MRFLGSPEVLLDGQPVRFRSRKVLALLAYLAIEGGSHRREKLIDLFWPDSPPGKGAATLRSTLSRLRESLGAASGSLVSDGDGIRFDDGDAHFVDVAALEMLGNAPMRVIDKDLYQVARGRLLEGFSVGGSPEFDDWVGRWSALCLSRSCALLGRAARWHIETGQLADAEKAVSRWMTYGPFDDAPVMLMVEVHALRGARVAALETYETYVELLRSELGAEPGDQLEYLIQRVRDGEVGYESPHEALRALLARAEEEVAASRAHVAVVYFDQAVALLDSVGAAEADELTNEIFTKRGRALELSHRFEDAVSNYEELAARADHAHNLSWKLSSLIGRTRLHSTPTQLTDPVVARLYGEQALDLARLLGDRENEAEALWSMLLVDHYSLGDEDAALEHGLAGLEIARRLEGSPVLPHLLNDLHWAYATRGDLGEAAALLAEAIAEWDRVGNEAMLIDSLNGAGLLFTLTGDFPAAISAADRGSAIALRTKNVWNQLSINANLALLHRERGDHRQGLSVLRAAIDAAAAEMPVARPYYQVMLATLLGDFGLAIEVDEICDDIEANSAELPPFWRISEATRTLRIRGLVSKGVHTADDLDGLAALSGETIGLAQASTLAPFVEMEAALAMGVHSSAIATADSYLARAARSAARFGCAEARLRKGQAQVCDGAIDEALATLMEAESEADELGLLRVRWQIQAELAVAFAAHGDGAESREWSERALDSHGEVSVLIPRGELREIHDARQPRPVGDR
jgi:DNA-binding SARP family transcriptional activator